MKKLIILLCLLTTPIFAKEYQIVECNDAKVGVEIPEGYFAKCIEEKNKVIIKKIYDYEANKKYPRGRCYNTYPNKEGMHGTCKFRYKLDEPFIKVQKCYFDGYAGPDCHYVICFSRDGEDAYELVGNINNKTGEVGSYCP